MSLPSNILRGDHVPDEDLLQLVRTDSDPQRRRAAATELVSRYRDAVYLWCFRYTRDRERALDLSQDVLTTVWQKVGSFEGRAKFSSWLFSVTRNRCIDASRRVEPPTDDIDDAGVVDAGSRPDEILERSGESGLLALLRTALAADEQEAVWLHYVECFPIDEVSRIMRLDTVSGARAVLQRARRKLRAARASGSEGN
jgi:RNA polymerase sigma-70 factor (ECF subfamily)